jgi:hypothetical protein
MEIYKAGQPYMTDLLTDMRNTPRGTDYFSWKIIIEPLMKLFGISGDMNSPETPMHLFEMMMNIARASKGLSADFNAASFMKDLARKIGINIHSSSGSLGAVPQLS